MQSPIYPCLWFEDQAKEAAEYYCTVFPNSKILHQSPVAVNFELNGNPFMALNQRRPPNHFNEAVSFVITCTDQSQIDHYWDQLTANGGKEGMCGWCTDKYGVSWQVVPAILGKLMSDPEKAEKAAQAFLKMQKLDIEKIVQATG